MSASMTSLRNRRSARASGAPRMQLREPLVHALARERRCGIDAAGEVGLGGEEAPHVTAEMGSFFEHCVARGAGSLRGPFRAKGAGPPQAFGANCAFPAESRFLLSDDHW